MSPMGPQMDYTMSDEEITTTLRRPGRPKTALPRIG